MQPFFAYLVLLLPSSLLHSCSLLLGDSSSASSSLLSLAWLVGWSDWLARWLAWFLAFWPLDPRTSSSLSLLLPSSTSPLLLALLPFPPPPSLSAFCRFSDFYVLVLLLHWSRTNMQFWLGRALFRALGL